MKIRWFEGLALGIAALCVALFFLCYFSSNLSGEVVITTDRGAGAEVSVNADEETVLDLNTATLDELDELPYISRSVAQRILNYRVKCGGFRSVDELLNVKGISEELLNEIRSYVCVEEG